MEKNPKKNLVILLLVFFICSLVLMIIISFYNLDLINNEFASNETNQNNAVLPLNNNADLNNENEIINNQLSNFDLSFLKLENQKENKVYSPLSIKYALKMLEEGASGESKAQISKIIGDYNLTKYNSNENMSFANSLFIRDSFKQGVKQSYIDTLKNKYDAEVKFDKFENAKNINDWIKNKTLNIIPKMVEDNDVTQLDFALINALAIDMEWKEKFILLEGVGAKIEYLHEKRETLPSDEYMYQTNINVYDTENVSSEIFKNGHENLKVSGMHIEAAINNYDIVNILGEENIRNIVANEYRKFAKGEEYDEKHAYGDFLLSEDTTDAGIEEALDEFLPNYISELKENYHKSGSSTEFSMYVDNDVKIFAKDLKEYDNTMLQYIGIMPINYNLDEFITETNSIKINNYINKLKSIDSKDFKEGVVTKITGYIPKFNFEYNLNLMDDLKEQNITDIFDSEKADLRNIIDIEEENSYISTALHKANIEFTQDGIKAAAATMLGGYGAGDPFDYLFDVPVEEIDLTFDKPYMFLIRDKQIGDTWFVGTVYEPLLWEDEPEKENVWESE